MLRRNTNRLCSERREGLMRESTLTVLAAVAATLLTQPIRAQQLDPLVTPPPNAVLPNANGVPVGPFGGLEAGAYAARVDDPSAAWFNPAGLSRAKTAQISGSGGSTSSPRSRRRRCQIPAADCSRSRT